MSRDVPDTVPGRWQYSAGEQTRVGVILADRYCVGGVCRYVEVARGGFDDRAVVIRGDRDVYVNAGGERLIVREPHLAYRDHDLQLQCVGNEQ